MLLYTLTPAERQAAIAVVQQAVAAGALDTLVDHVFDLDDIVQAHELQEAGPTGRVLVAIH
jgi:NADPH:quinone reductase-like Zn-dependent oxidoreductase